MAEIEKAIVAELGIKSRGAAGGVRPFGLSAVPFQHQADPGATAEEESEKKRALELIRKIGSRRKLG